MASASGGGKIITLPVEQMRASAAELEQTGVTMQDDVQRDIQRANSLSWEIPTEQRAVEQELESRFTQFYLKMLEARSLMAVVLNASADDSQQQDNDLFNAF